MNILDIKVNIKSPEQIVCSPTLTSILLSKETITDQEYLAPPIQYENFKN